MLKDFQELFDDYIRLRNENLAILKENGIMRDLLRQYAEKNKEAEK